MSESDPALNTETPSATVANVRAASIENRLGEADRLAGLEARVAHMDAIMAEREKEWRLYADALGDRLGERLDAMDKATALLSDTVNRVPTETQREVGHLEGLMNERFGSVGTQFNERDTRSERESRDNKVAVDAAFAAQKEAAAKQDESNAKAIDKSEAATSETINKLSELFKSSTDALGDKHDDLKQRVQAIESGGTGRTNAQAEGRQMAVQSTSHYALIAALVVGSFTVLGVVIAAIALILHG